MNTRKKNKGSIHTDEGNRLLESFLAGNDDAFSSIYKKYVDELFAYGTGLCFERETLKDAIQDIFCKLYFDKKGLRNVKQLKHYLFIMLRNRLIDIHRTSMNLNLTDFHQSKYEMTFSIKSTILDDIIGEEERNNIQQRIDTLLNKLTDRQREAVYLRFIHEMKYEEIAVLLNMTLPAVRKLVARAMKSMRDEKKI